MRLDKSKRKILTGNSAIFNREIMLINGRDALKKNSSHVNIAAHNLFIWKLKSEKNHKNGSTKRVRELVPWNYVACLNDS